jgi:hypothetical protein
MKFKCHFVTLFLVFILPAYGQDFKSCRAKLKSLFTKIDYWSAYRFEDRNTDNPYDSLSKYNTEFEHQLLQCTRNNPESLQDRFPELAQLGLDVITSPDGNLRIYSWDTQDGGTMHNFRNLFQYRTNGKTFSRSFDIEKTDENRDSGCAYFEINEVVSQGRKFYLASSYSVYSTAGSGHAIEVFTIDGDVLDDEAVLIKTQSGIKSHLFYSIDLSDSANADVELDDYTDLRIQYDTKTKTIILPLINENGGLTKKKIKYRFDGKYFTKIK